MKLKQFATVILISYVIWFAAHDAQAFYNPSTGRWLSRDPIEEGGGPNIYGFVQNNQVNGADKLGLDILVYCPEGYFSELGLEKGVHYTGNGNTYSAIPGRFNPGNETEKLIVWRMLSTSHKYKALGLRVEELKKHVQARLTIVRNALRANFRFDVDGGLTRDELLEFRKNPAKFFESINNTGRGFACQELTMILFETGNQFRIRDYRGYDGIWVPGDWAYIENRSYTPKEWGRGYNGENLIHTGTLLSKDAYGDLFWGHFVEHVHPSITEREWFNDISEWQSIDGRKSGDPHWSGQIKGPGFGLEPNYRGE